ncbi:conserved hypothetical protein [Candidatus Nitrotoga sp. BS]|nr:conserved hypothetical protein [Candidatus Nitrotoga sp. BS]
MNYETNKTLFPFIDKAGYKSIITLDKFTADALPKIVGDVHTWVQTQYEKIIAGEKKLSRRAVGDIIRRIAFTLVINDIDECDL